MLKMLELLLPPLPLTSVLCALISWLTYLFPSLSLNIPYGDIIAIIFWLMGTAFVLPAAISFFNAKTTVDPRTPEKSKTLVINGLYKISRNPMYVGFLFYILGTAFFYTHISGLIIAVLFVPYMNRFQISLEEQQLNKTFGTQYSEYCQSVRRWL